MPGERPDFALCNRARDCAERSWVRDPIEIVEEDVHFVEDYSSRTCLELRAHKDPGELVCCADDLVSGDLPHSSRRQRISHLDRTFQQASIVESGAQQHLRAVQATK